MSRENLNDLIAFTVVAREQNFTRAAGQLKVTQSALSHAIRSLEKRLGVRLLTRTTRHVLPTAVGEKLLNSIIPHLDMINEAIASLNDYRDKPAGTIRISTDDLAIHNILWPKLKTFLVQYPDIHVELLDDYALTDIVADRIDAGTRLGEHLQNGMISVKIGPDIKFAVIGSPSYFQQNKIPQNPEELTHHRCINLRLPTYNNIYAWEFEKDNTTLKIQVNGQVTFSRVHDIIQASLDGFGLGYVPYEVVKHQIQSGKLISVLEDWLPFWAGYYLYYPSRHQHTQAFKLLIDALRYKD